MSDFFFYISSDKPSRITLVTPTKKKNPEKLRILGIWAMDKIWYMARGTSLIRVGPIGLAVMPTPGPSQYYFGHT